MPELLPLEPELEPLLGVLGEVLLEPDLPAPAAPEAPALPLVLGDALGEAELPPPEALEPAFAPKCLSHSAREIWPSPFASTEVKLGCALEELDAPPDALELLGELALGELELLELLGELALGVLELELPPELALEPELFAASELLDPLVALGVLEAPEAPDVLEL